MDELLMKPIINMCDSLRDPITCQVTDTVAEVLELFQKHKIGCVIVMNDDFIAGIFTERDYIMKVAGNEEMILESFRIEEYMTPSPKTVMLDSKILLGMNHMRVGKFRHLVVVDKAAKLQKVLSIKDFLDFFIDQTDI